MTQICPFKEAFDCTNLIEIMLQLECMNVHVSFTDGSGLHPSETN